MVKEIQLEALQRILAAEYNLLELYQIHLENAPESPLSSHLERYREMAGELRALLEEYGRAPSSDSGATGTVFRLGQMIGGSDADLVRQIELSIEEKYQYLSRVPPKAQGIVEEHLGIERQLLAELKTAQL